jgi:hypothetical protein
MHCLLWLVLLASRPLIMMAASQAKQPPHLNPQDSQRQHPVVHWQARVLTSSQLTSSLSSS